MMPPEKSQNKALPYFGEFPFYDVG
jgi:hypothetical protein